MLTPLRDKIVVKLVKSPTETRGLIRLESETPIRRVVCEAVGPDAHSAEVGEQYLANVLMGQAFGEEHVVLPEKALIAVWLG